MEIMHHNTRQPMSLPVTLPGLGFINYITMAAVATVLYTDRTFAAV
jgi:hypothetical protein